AAHLGNTPAICRKCYVHPGVLDFYTNGSILEPEPTACVEATTLSDRMREDEAWTLDLLRRITASSMTLIGAA
ncbi:MAG: topoisomerase, partial [Chloroflexi bacterium]|nr:topoisomerase [Chloroflexota bacterium]